MTTGPSEPRSRPSHPPGNARARVTRVQQLQRERRPREVLSAQAAPVTGIVELPPPLPRQRRGDRLSRRGGVFIVAITHNSAPQKPRAVDPGWPPQVPSQGSGDEVCQDPIKGHTQKRVTSPDAALLRGVAVRGARNRLRRQRGRPFPGRWERRRSLRQDRLPRGRVAPVTTRVLTLASPKGTARNAARMTASNCAPAPSSSSARASAASRTRREERWARSLPRRRRDGSNKPQQHERHDDHFGDPRPGRQRSGSALDGSFPGFHVREGRPKNNPRRRFRSPRRRPHPLGEVKARRRHHP